MIQKKLELTAIGYLFTLLNIFMTVRGIPLVGIAFGFVACIFFIKALKIKE
jgi:hypothetical protein